MKMMFQNLVHTRSAHGKKRIRGKQWASSSIKRSTDSLDDIISVDPLDLSHSSLRTSHTTLDDSRLFYSSLDLSANSPLDQSRGSSSSSSSGNGSDEDEKASTSSTIKESQPQHNSTSSSDTTVPVIQEEWEEAENDDDGEACNETHKTYASTRCSPDAPLKGVTALRIEESECPMPPIIERQAISQPTASNNTKNVEAVTKQVTFGIVEIHEHVLALGGAVPSGGPSLTIEWESQAVYNITVEDYEEHRPITRKNLQLLRSRSQRIQV